MVSDDPKRKSSKGFDEVLKQQKKPGPVKSPGNYHRTQASERLQTDQALFHHWLPKKNVRRFVYVQVIPARRCYIDVMSPKGTHERWKPMDELGCHQ